MSDVTSPSSTAPEPLGFGARLVLAFILPWKVFFDGRLAAKVKLAESGAPAALPPSSDGESEAPAKTKALEDKIEELSQARDASEQESEKAAATIAALENEVATLKTQRAEQQKILDKRNDPDGALHLLRILQRDGRLIDFLREDIAGFGDADIGGAARLVHEGCRKALDEYFVLERVRSEEEGTAVEIPAGFDAQRIRLTGNVSGDGPYKGTLAHAGWKAAEVKLPSLPPEHEPSIIAPAEVEL